MLGKHSNKQATALGAVSKSQSVAREKPSTKQMYYCEKKEAKAGALVWVEIFRMYSVSTYDPKESHA